MAIPIGQSYTITNSTVSGTVNVVPGGTFSIMMPPPPTAITFGNGAFISWDKGVLRFEGEFDESAKCFLEFLKPYVDAYIKSIVPYDNLKYLEWCAHEGKNAK